MFFGIKKQILFLKRNSLELLEESGKIQISCDFPENVVHNLEIQNLEQFDLLIHNFVTKVKKPKMDLILILSDQLIFSRSYPAKIPLSQSLNENFLNTVPFASDDILFIHYLTPEWLTYLAVNKNLIQNLKKIMKSSGWTVWEVLPGFMFGKPNPDGSLNQELISQIGKKQKLVKEYNFLS